MLNHSQQPVCHQADGFFVSAARFAQTQEMLYQIYKIS